MNKLNLQNRKGQKIVGVLTKPEGEIIGTAVLQHGYGGVKEQFHIITMQDSFFKNGFQVFNFDATNSFGESDGEYKDARLGLHADDFEDVANWIQDQDWFTGKLLVSGHSMGGFASLRYALRNPDAVDFTIPLTPVISGELSIAAKRKYWPELFKKWEENGVQFKKSKSIPGMIKEEPWDVMVEMLEHSLFKETNQISNLLVIGCELDDLIPVEFLRIYFDSLHKGNKLEVINNTGHNPREKNQLKELKDVIDTWLKKKLAEN